MPAKKKTTAKKTKKVKNLQQAHGKVEKFEPSTLEQIWGDDGFDVYNTMIEAEYISQLDDMAKVDVQAHATKVGLIPTDNISTLREKLLKEFRRHVNLYRRPKVSKAKDPVLTKELKDILGEGK